MPTWNWEPRRGFPTRIRVRIVKRDPICKICGIEPSTIADHIIPVAEGGPDTLDNGQGVCSRCHDAKTREEQARGRARMNPKRTPTQHPGLR